MNKIKNLHDTSSFCFFVLAFSYVGMVLTLRNGYGVEFLVSLMRVLDLPFAFVALTYGATTLLLQLEYDKEGEVKNTGWFLAISILAMVLFAAVVVVSFGVRAIV